MGSIGKGSRADPRLVAGVLADAQQRRILSLVADGAAPLTERDLAVALVAREERKPTAQVTSEERRARRLRLHHQKLPKLESAGLIVRSSDGVRLVPSFPVDLSEFGVPLPSPEQTDDPRWDLVAALVARPYRQYIVSLLAEAPGSLTLGQVTERLLDADETDLTRAEVGAKALQTRLHHVDLPKLAALDVLSYDAADKTVRAERALTAVR
jgi:hypothetical protein